MAAYQAGSQEAFVALYDRHAAGVYSYLLRRLQNASAAADLYQEVFLRLHRARHSYDPNRPFRAWLFGIVHNLVTDSFRKTMRQPTSALETEAVDHRSAEKVATLRESGRALTRALDKLSREEAGVLILARIEGLPYDEIARIVGRSPAAVKQLAYRALKRLRAELRTAGHTEFD